MRKEYWIVGYGFGVIVSWSALIAAAYDTDPGVAVAAFFFGWLLSLGWPIFALAAIIYTIAF